LGKPGDVNESGQRQYIRVERINYSDGSHPGDELTLLDLGGVFVLSPRRSEVDTLADKIAMELAAQGESLESMLIALREARERYAA
jgi:hypothetical protein